MRTHLMQAGQLLLQIQHQLEVGDVAGAQATLGALQVRTLAARSDTRAVDWQLGARLPWVGAEVAAVRVVAEVLDELTHLVLPSLVDLSRSLGHGGFVPTQGWLDLAVLQRAGPVIVELASATRQASDRVAAVQREDLVPEVRQGVAELAEGLDRVVALTGTVARAAGLLPPLLGVDSPRTYLVLVQNPSEVRATGGMVDAFVVIQADHGVLRMVDQGTAAGQLRTFDEPVLPLDPQQRALYGDRLGTQPASINATPHFPTTAALGREMYRRRTGTTVDGVVAVDPVALSYLLGATGPLTLPDGSQLTADNAVRLLLLAGSTTAASPGDQERSFAAAAQTVFSALSQGRGVVEPRAALAALARAAGERRLLVWSAHPADQSRIAGTVLEGALPTQDGHQPVVGLFLNDAGGARLGYYLTHQASLALAGCRPDGRRELTVRARLGSTAPASGLPEYLLGRGGSDDPYTVRTLLMLFSPAGGAVTDVRVDGATVPFGSGTERSRAVAVVTVELNPGQSKVIEAWVLTEPLAGPAATSVVPSLWVTPGVSPWRLDVASSGGCASG